MVTRIITLITFSFTAFFSLHAQQKVCGTPEPTKEQRELFSDLLAPDHLRNGRVASTTSLAIVAHIIRQDDGTGGLTETELNDAIDNMNNFYTDAGLSFFILTINYIDDSKYFDFVTSDESEMTSANNFENTINIYFANSVGDGDGGFFCGYAYFPGGPDVILMDNGCTTNGSTLPHEVGHFFALFHTHGLSNSELTDELVTRGTGANCDTAGDQLCDTEADPNLSGKVNGSCQYTGSETDANGDSFTPDPANFMSYSLKNCRDVFTQDQYDRMNSAYLNNRNYLWQSNYIVDFTYSASSVCGGEEVIFTNESVNADSYAWVFEGGEPATSTDENPVVVYNTEGTFSVELTITSGNSTDTKTIDNAIQVESALSSSETEAAGSFEESEIQEKIVNPDNGITWERREDVRSDGVYSMSIDFYNYQDQSQEDYLVFAVLNTATEKTFDLSFDYAYAPYSDSFYDGLAIAYKGSCENNWQTIYFKEGSELQTAAATASQFLPAPEDWQAELISIEIPVEYDVVEIAFVGLNGWGNMLYVDNYSIAAAGAISISSLEVQHASCPDASDGAIAVSASGNGPFEYSINGGSFSAINEFLDLEPGDYEILIRDANLNEVSKSVQVLFEDDYPEKPLIETGNAELIVQVQNEQTVQWYVNGVLDADATTAVYANPVSGTYAVEVYNGSCGTMSDTFEVQEVSIQSVNIINSSCPDVADGALEIVASGTPPLEYSFSGGEFNDQNGYEELLPGSYMISVTNFLGNILSQQVEVLSENEYPDKPLITEEEGALSIDLLEGQTAQWYLDGEMIDGETSASLAILGGGEYLVEVSNGSCATLSDPFVVLSVADEIDDVTLSPNPVTSKLTIAHGRDQLKTQFEQISITDLAGKLIMESAFSRNVDVTDLKSGVYLLHLQSSNQNIVKRFVKQ